jgi:methyltransferase (TIGR00027 family)
MGPTEINMIGRTALEVARLRATEDRRPDRLFTDPYAAIFLDAAGFSVTSPLAKKDATRGFEAIMGEQVAVRTRFLDEALTAAVTDGCHQVVLVASGMDSRPWRLNWPPATDLFELDQRGVLQFKDKVMATRSEPHGVRHPVPVDLRADWTTELLRAGFRPDRKAVWLIEGVLYALDETAEDQLLAAIITVSAPGSRLAFDHVETSAPLRAALTQMHPGLVTLWQSGPTDPAAWLRQHGWRPDLHALEPLAREYGRHIHPAYDPEKEGTAHAWLGRALLPSLKDTARS